MPRYIEKGGGESAKPKKKKPGKPAGNAGLGNVVSGLLKATSNLGTQAIKAQNVKRAKQMPSVAKQRGFHVVGNKAYYSNARGQVVPLNRNDVLNLITGSQGSMGMYGPKVFQGGFRQRGVGRTAVLEGLLSERNRLPENVLSSIRSGSVYDPRWRSLVRIGATGRPMEPMIIDPRLAMRVPQPAVNTPEYAAYERAMAEYDRMRAPNRTQGPDIVGLFKQIQKNITTPTRRPDSGTAPTIIYQ